MIGDGAHGDIKLWFAPLYEETWEFILNGMRHMIRFNNNSLCSMRRITFKSDDCCLFIPVILCLMRNMRNKKTLMEIPTRKRHNSQQNSGKYDFFLNSFPLASFLLITTQWRQCDTKWFCIQARKYEIGAPTGRRSQNRQWKVKFCWNANSARVLFQRHAGWNWPLNTLAY